MSFKLYLEAFTNRFINPDHLTSTFNNLCFIYKANGKLIKNKNVEHERLVNENPEELAQIIISDIEKKRVHFEKLVL